MKKLYNFRLDPTLINAVDKLNGSRTSIVTNALQLYLQSDSQNSYNVNNSYLLHLESEVEYLRGQVNGLLLTKFPLLTRLKMKLLESNTKKN